MMAFHEHFILGGLANVFRTPRVLRLRALKGRRKLYGQFLAARIDIIIKSAVYRLDIADSIKREPRNRPITMNTEHR